MISQIDGDNWQKESSISLTSRLEIQVSSITSSLQIIISYLLTGSPSLVFTEPMLLAPVPEGYFNGRRG